MHLTTTSLREAPPAATPLAKKLLNIFVSPGEVCEEVVTSPTTLMHSLAPFLFVCLTGLLSLLVFPTAEWDLTQVQPPAVADASVSSGMGRLFPQAAALLTVVASAFAGTLWSTIVLWMIGRMFLKARFSLLKTLEVTALTGMILGLGTLVTVLLGLATGDASARPALSLFVGQSDLSPRTRAALGALNFFHLWAAMVLAIGLAKLARVSFSESAFWVLGYWVGLRLAIICLA